MISSAPPIVSGLTDFVSVHALFVCLSATPITDKGVRLLELNVIYLVDDSFDRCYTKS